MPMANLYAKDCIVCSSDKPESPRFLPARLGLLSSGNKPAAPLLVNPLLHFNFLATQFLAMKDLKIVGNTGQVIWRKKKRSCPACRWPRKKPAPTLTPCTSTTSARSRTPRPRSRRRNSAIRGRDRHRRIETKRGVVGAALGQEILAEKCLSTSARLLQPHVRIRLQERKATRWSRELQETSNGTTVGKAATMTKTAAALITAWICRSLVTLCRPAVTPRPALAASMCSAVIPPRANSLSAPPAEAERSTPSSTPTPVAPKGARLRWPMSLPPKELQTQAPLL